MFKRLKDKHRGAVERLFKRQRVAQLSELRSALGVRSRTTVFFALKAIGYYSSYTHAGRYYTLAHIPRFDADGLWSHEGVRFSQHGTLRSTTIVLVRGSSQGYTHEELRVALGVRVHDTLRSLVEDELLRRERIDAVYVYTDADPRRAAAQLEQRGRSKAPVTALGSARADRAAAPLDLTLVVDILLAVIAAPKDSATMVAARLRHGGADVSDEQVEAVFAHYALGKKTAGSPSKP